MARKIIEEPFEPYEFFTVRFGDREFLSRLTKKDGVESCRSLPEMKVYHTTLGVKKAIRTIDEMSPGEKTTPVHVRVYQRGRMHVTEVNF